MQEDQRRRFFNLALQVVTEHYPNLGRLNRNHFNGVVAILANEYIAYYSSDTAGSDEHIKDLMIINLEELRIALNQ